MNYNSHQNHTFYTKLLQCHSSRLYSLVYRDNVNESIDKIIKYLTIEYIDSNFGANYKHSLGRMT